jgi:CheY-like chemotaxis protein
MMKKTILIIDDDADFRSAIRSTLEEAGYQILEAASTGQGRCMLSETRPDLILLDIMLEDISSGFRFLREIRNHAAQNGEKNIPILMISAIKELTDLDFHSRGGTELLPVDAFLDKPVLPENLIKQVQKLITE